MRGQTAYADGDDRGVADAMAELSQRDDAAGRRGYVQLLCRSGLADAAFRVIQESLHNATKYARASHVTVEIKLHNTNDVFITVRDDGRGFDPTQIVPRDGWRNAGRGDSAFTNPVHAMSPRLRSWLTASSKRP
jgi:signal transduction histidine kinase